MPTCNHDHQHYEITGKNNALYAAIFVALFGIIEAVGGWWSGSLTLLSDAGHMGADALALTLAAFASWIKRKPTTTRHTYGFGRAEVLASWFSSILLLGIIISITIEAIHRLHDPPPIASTTVILIASIGLIINIATAIVLYRGEKTLNTKAALLHVMSDLLGSIVVLISGTIIYFTGWSKIDPILSIVICILILISTINLLRESILVLMEGTPSHINYKKVEQTIKNVPGVKTTHDLHIWTLTSGVTLLTIHVVVADHMPWPKIIDNIHDIIKRDFGINHSTIQIETPDQANNCADCGYP